MKNYFFLLAVSLFLFSCGDDPEPDPDPPTPAEQIIGTWTVDMFAIDSCPDAGINATTIIAEDGCLVLFGESQCLSFTFDNTMLMVSVSYDGDTPELTSVPYTIDDTGNVMACDDDNDCIEGVLSNDVFTLNTMEDNCPVRVTFKK